MSLVCPFLCLLWGSARIIIYLADGERLTDFFVSHYFPNAVCFAAVLVGGILSAVLTLTRKIHTEDYLLKRLAVMGAVIVFHQIMIFIGNALIVEPCLSLAGAAAVIYQILKVQNEDTSGGERAVMMMSDPILYLTIFWILELLVTLLSDLSA